MRYADPKSRQQIAHFRVHEMHAARWRNAKNLERWNDACRDRWEAEAVGAATKREPIDFERLPA
jgi:hypothetical protein